VIARVLEAARTCFETFSIGRIQGSMYLEYCITI